MSPTGGDSRAWAIHTQGLGKDYGRLHALSSLDLRVPSGACYGLLGHNGSGKTTTVHILTTLVRPTRGVARVAGHDVLKDPVLVRRAIGLVFQDSALDRNLTVEENLRFAAALHGLPSREARARIAGLLDLFELGDRSRWPIPDLSGGMRRAVDIIRGVIHHPTVLILDEPTTGLDPSNRRVVWRFIDRLRTDRGVSVLVSTHDLAEAGGCDHVIFLKQGRMIGEGRPASLAADLCARVLEIEGDVPEALERSLAARFGPALVADRQRCYRVPESAMGMIDLPRIGDGVTGVRLRQPDLSDVYLWLNAPGPESTGSAPGAP